MERAIKILLGFIGVIAFFALLGEAATLIVALLFIIFVFKASGY